ncbi:ATP-grasp domain-containing protein [Herbaspirillum sp. NPDC087042]|uniref:ATP-grasp domain-containing protein n=1 Tax=Herbaspirillum sp. NPDC087042 TaxID=3364004 RepID=UPI00380CEE8A
MSKVLILGGRAPVALDHARRFAAQGWQVIMADSVSCRLSSWSSAVHEAVRLPSPRRSPELFVAEIRSVIRRYGIDMVLPTCEEVFYLSRYRRSLPQSCRIVCDEFDKLRTLHSKWDFLALIRQAGGHAPESWLVDDLSQAHAWAQARPVVLKPEFSRFGVHVRICPQGLADDMAPLPALGRWVVQQYCEGSELCSYSIADRGRLLAHALYRPRHRLNRSASFYFEQQQRQEVLDVVTRLVAQLEFTGQISFDWIEAADGRLYPLECNPRATSGLHLFGLDDDVPAALCGDVAEMVFPPQGAACMLAPIMYGPGLFKAVTGGQVASWRDDSRRARDVLCAWPDLAPLAGGVVDMACFAANALVRGCSLREAATSDIEWDGEELPCL